MWVHDLVDVAIVDGQSTWDFMWLLEDKMSDHMFPKRFEVSKEVGVMEDDDFDDDSDNDDSDSDDDWWFFFKLKEV